MSLFRPLIGYDSEEAMCRKVRVVRTSTFSATVLVTHRGVLIRTGKTGSSVLQVAENEMTLRTVSDRWL